MPVVTSDEFARWLRRLDGDALTAFVADLYAARGESVAVRDDGAVVLRDGGRVFSPVPGRRRLRRPSVAADADAVVAARPTSALLRRAARADASVVGPAELRDLALYGLDRRDAERLFRKHFDASPVVDAPNPDESSGRRAALGRVGDSLGMGVAAVVLAALVVAALFGPFGLALPPTDGAAGSTSGSGGGAEPTARTESESFPPGIGPTGVTDPEGLAAAHADAAVDRSYRLVVRASGTETWDGDVWTDVRRRAAVAGPLTYRYAVVGSLRDGDDGATADGSLVRYAAYADGRYTYVRNNPEGEEERFRRYPARLDEGGHGVIERGAAVAVARYLNATRTSVAREAESSRLRVVATGVPEAVDDPASVDDYRAEARVAPDGFVETLVVSYNRTDGGEARRVTYRLTYDDVGAVDVSPPAWYERARTETRPDSPPPMSTPDRMPPGGRATGSESSADATAACRANPTGDDSADGSAPSPAVATESPSHSLVTAEPTC
ncbi:hypothetical protein [Halogeometricum luteum]|uniref:Uncharacterized protein n=1 Tax=Halogeometricum luteum TaxID=2950537 RepID=A0ABU2FVT9_9EURY|nr:hypothetical protein [Halogeometricum sp. S3BR5-2]MDS0292662.1 hypothetical protein [Halogeometricum sp. S3BR5-2]